MDKTEFKHGDAVRRIRKLNDALRHGHPGIGTIMVTAGVRDKGFDFLEKVTQAVAEFDTFNGDNDPFGEHDFGIVEVDGEKIFWKIDYYDLSLKYHSPDVNDPSVTHRVLTIMLAREY